MVGGKGIPGMLFKMKNGGKDYFKVKFPEGSNSGGISGTNH